MNKTCNRCFTEKPIEDFYKDQGSKGGYKNQCKLCIRGYQKTYLVPDYQFAARLKSIYKITLEEYEAMEKAQDYKCFLCLKPYHRKLYVEHCHKTGKVRGLACAPCNTTLGHLENNPEVLERMQILLGL